MSTEAFFYISVMKQANAEIVQGLRRRNPDLLDQLIERYHYRLMRYLLHLTGNRETAEDVFQETWVRVLERGHQYNGKAKFETWLFSVARHLVIDLFRKKKPASLEVLRGSGEDTGPIEIESTDQPSPFEFASGREEAAHIGLAMGHLNPVYREVLVLRFQEELSLNEITRVVDTSLPTVKTRLYRGLQALRSRLEEARLEREKS